MNPHHTAMTLPLILLVTALTFPKVAEGQSLTHFEGHVPWPVETLTEPIGELLDAGYSVVSQGLGNGGPSFTLQKGTSVAFCEVILSFSRDLMRGQPLETSSVCHLIN